MIIMPKEVCRFSSLTIKHATPFFTEIKIIIQKFIWKQKRFSLSRKWYLSSKYFAEGFTLSNFKLYHRIIEIKTIQYHHKIRHANEWNRIGHPDRNSFNYNHLTFCKEIKYTHWRKESFQQTVLGNTVSPCVKESNQILLSHSGLYIYLQFNNNTSSSS